MGQASPATRTKHTARQTYKVERPGQLTILARSVASVFSLNPIDRIWHTV
jgi:hypothetical protein